MWFTAAFFDQHPVLLLVLSILIRKQAGGCICLVICSMELDWSDPEMEHDMQSTSDNKLNINTILKFNFVHTFFISGSRVNS